MEILEKLFGKTVAVTGASGYIGAALVDALLKYGCNVIRVSRFELSPIANTKTIIGDVRFADTWSEIITRADIIYHLAGNTSVYEAEKNPAESLSSTLLPLNHLIKSTQLQKCKPRVVFASTATVYGLTSELPVSENIKPKPITVYDLHKMFAEQQLALATQQDRIEGVSLRLANVYGPSAGISSADDRGILNRVTAKALRGENLFVYGHGNYLRDYIYITDVINAFLFAAVVNHIGGQVFNVSTGIGTTIKQAFEMIAQKAEKLTGKLVDVGYQSWPESTSSIEFREFTANIKKYTNISGWKPLINLEDGVEMLMLQYLKERYEK